MHPKMLTSPQGPGTALLLPLCLAPNLYQNVCPTLYLQARIAELESEASDYLSRLGATEAAAARGAAAQLKAAQLLAGAEAQLAAARTEAAAVAEQHERQLAEQAELLRSVSEKAAVQKAALKAASELSSAKERDMAAKLQQVRAGHITEQVDGPGAVLRLQQCLVLAELLLSACSSHAEKGQPPAAPRCAHPRRLRSG